MKNPFSKKEDKPTTLESIELNERMNVQAGISDLKGEEQLRNRVLFNEEAIVDEINDINKSIFDLYMKTPFTDIDKKLIEGLEAKRRLYRFYRTLKKSSVPWGLAGLDKGMSEKLGAIDTLFFSCQNNEAMQSLMLTAMEKNVNDCYREDWHVHPAPSVLMNKPVVMTQGGAHVVSPTSGLPSTSPAPSDKKYPAQVDSGV